MKYYSISEKPFSVHGLIMPGNGERYKRLPEEVAENTNGGVAGLNYNTAGGRVRFKTDSKVIGLKAVYPTDVWKYPNMPPMAQFGFDLYADSDDGGRYCGSFVADIGEDKTSRGEIRFDTAEERELTVFFPIYCDVADVEIGIEEGATLSAHSPYKHKRPVVYYGSSITQGASAGRPALAYSALISRRLDTEFTNLGFSGSAKGETVMAEYISSLDMSVFVMDYDHNADTQDMLRDTHEPFYRIIRTAQPDTPIIFVTRPDFHEPVNASSAEDAGKRREIVRATYERAVAAGDKNVFFVDGGLFARDLPVYLRDICTQDGCHPTGAGFMFMAKDIGDAIERSLE